ncbi:FHA domain-containing protein [Allorhodopirellula solitaria]|uniref:FHA domain-containing protein n=1 Tax=Allorhodopirellula solitaria TaxID=2527987 RepID=UPI0011B610C5|nr:FHA domain-containing protein [Allorhodopirellula solitaria]
MANDDSQNRSHASNTLDEAAVRFDVASWQTAPPSHTGGDRGANDVEAMRRSDRDHDLDAWATTPSAWQQKTAMEFRVRCQGRPTRRLRLPGARYTLGSGVGCSIPLDDTSLRPLHAVLIRDGDRILVRAYSAPFQINDGHVNEGLLAIGDRLRLGAYEFELLESVPDSVDAIARAISHGVVGCDDHGMSPADSCDEQWSRSLHEEAKQWRALKQDTQRREAWCQNRERELQEQQDALAQQLEIMREREADLQTQESAAAEVHEEFQHHFNELSQHREELKLQQDELNAGREHLRLQQERLDGRDRLHRQQIDKLISEQEQFKRVEADSQQKLADSEDQLQASRRQAETATSAVAQMREKFVLLSDQLEQLTRHQESLKQLETQREHEYRQQSEELELARDEAIAERDYASAQRDHATTQRDEMALQRGQLAAQRDELAADRDAIANQRDEIATQRDELAVERDELATARDGVQAERDEFAACCQELELIEKQLRSEVELLQGEIARTREDAETLNESCRVARHQVSELEETARASADQFDAERQSWTEVVDALRQNIDELSSDLANAQGQLSKLREDNAQLSEQLTGTTAERDEARAQREVAIEQCQAAQLVCDTATMDCESARRDLDAARLDVEQARQERDEAVAHRDEVLALQDEVSAERSVWSEQKSQAEQRYQEARSHLADAREKCERAVRARDEAEAARLSAEEELAVTLADLQNMQAERDDAIADQDELRRQRDLAIQDAKDTRDLFDRSNRDHDDTLDLIERLEQKTREVMDTFETEPTGSKPPRLSLLDQEYDAAVDPQPSTATLSDDSASMDAVAQTGAELAESFDADDVWPMYSSKELEAEPSPKVPQPSVSVAEPSVDESAANDIAPTDSEQARHSLPIVSIVMPDEEESVNAECRDEIASLKINADAGIPDSTEEELAIESPASEELPQADAATVETVKKTILPEDDSIEAYMNRLLLRVQGRITDAAPGTAAEEETEESEEQPSIGSTLDAVPDETQDAHHEPSLPLPPSVKLSDDQRTKLTVSSPPVRNAASRRGKPSGSSNRTQSIMKFTQMGVALVCGIAAVVLVNLPMLKLVAAVAAVLVAAICAKEALALRAEVASFEAKRRESSSGDAMPSKAAA